jgi:hypothetical protein
MPGRLNSFQRTMLDWNDLHPYNAVHALRVCARFVHDRVLRAIHSTLERRGISTLEIDRKRRTFSYLGEPAKCEVTVLPENSRAAMLAEVERQINTRFPCDQPFCPFRFFVAPENGSFMLGIVYFHAIADAEAIVCLLREIVKDLSGVNSTAARAPEIYPAPRDRVPPGLLWRKLAAMPAHLRNLRRTCRPLYHKPHDAEFGFDLFLLSAASLNAGSSVSKTWGVTLNDLFLAVLLKELAPLAKKRVAGSRKNITLGCIVNLRRDLGLDGEKTFGLFLGSFLVSLQAEGEMTLQSVARAVRQQTQVIKQRQLSLATPVVLAIGRVGQAFFSLERRGKFYQKNHPLWGGITNMNLNSIWKPDSKPEPANYFRAVSTGPATPLVLSITTAGDTANVGLSYRKAVFSPEQIEGFKTGFLASFTELERAA